jgi:hypothetical protein
MIVEHSRFMGFGAWLLKDTAITRMTAYRRLIIVAIIETIPLRRKTGERRAQNWADKILLSEAPVL